MTFSYSKTISDYFLNSHLFYYFLSDIKGNFISVNSLVQKKLNHDLRDSSVTDIFIDANKYYEIVKQCCEKPGVIVNTTFDFRSQEGIDITTAWEFSACNNNEDDSIYIQAIGMAVDEGKNKQPAAIDELTERYKVYEQKHLAKLIESVSDIIFSQDKDLNIILWNKAAVQLYGYSAEEMIGRKIHDFLKFEYQGISHTEFFNILFTQGGWQGEAHVVNRFGRHITILTTITQLLNEKGEMTGFVSVSKDITEQKLLTQRLIEQEIQKQKQLTQATIDGQEKERLEIGKELHDNISQHLTITRLYLEVIKEKKPEEIHEIINHAHKNLSGIINKIRHLSQSLVPPTLGDIGLIESIQEICDSLKRTHTFNIEFYHRHFNEEALPDNLKLMLFRIIQEQVNNIIRHAHADAIQIRLQSDAEYIILTVADNGKGFDTSNYKKGLGLASITNRANLFNGKVEIDTLPGKGCSLSVAIPSVATGLQEMN